MRRGNGHYTYKSVEEGMFMWLTISKKCLSLGAWEGNEMDNSKDDFK